MRVCVFLYVCSMCFIDVCVFGGGVFLIVVSICVSGLFFGELLSSFFLYLFILCLMCLWVWVVFVTLYGFFVSLNIAVQMLRWK